MCQCENVIARARSGFLGIQRICSFGVSSVKQALNCEASTVGDELGDGSHCLPRATLDGYTCHDTRTPTYTHLECSAAHLQPPLASASASICSLLEQIFRCQGLSL